MPMLANPSSKYYPYTPLALPDRQWPQHVLTRAPIWLSTDLRDGNQALAQPMTATQKHTLFRHLVECGFKEIEVAYPAASDTEFEFVRALIKEGQIPDDVWIQVMTPARAELMHRTFESLEGAKKVIVSLFNATAPCFREVVYGKTKEEVIELATTHTTLLRELVQQHRTKYGSKFRLVYGVEAFSQTEPEYVVEICTAVKQAWGLAGKAWDEKIMYNLPSTVEISPPNHYADQIEYFCTHMADRDEIIVSLHTHNDRGTAVAATELGLMAGADRVEGCLLGNGERCGNVDLVTLALNLYTQGVSPALDFSQLPRTLAVVAQCTALPVHPRHPYAGELVFTAFSGSHQDAIKKGLEARSRALAQGDTRWCVPYLPLDPTDVGRTYEAVIRVNSQSGKGGIAYVVRTTLHIDLPRPVQQEFYRVVQRLVDRGAREMTPDEIKATFAAYYHLPRLLEPCADVGEGKDTARVRLHKFAAMQGMRDGRTTMTFQGQMSVDNDELTLRGDGPSQLEGLLAAIETRTGLHFSALETQERASLDPTSGHIVAFVLLAETHPAVNGTASGSKNGNGNGNGHQAHAPTWGVGIDTDSARAQVRAAVSAMNKHLGTRPVSIASAPGDLKEILRILHDDYSLPIPPAMHSTVSLFAANGEGGSSAQIAARFVGRYCHPYTNAHAHGGGATLETFSISRIRKGNEARIRLNATLTVQGEERETEAYGDDAVRCLLSGLSDVAGNATARNICVQPCLGAAKGSQHAAFVLVGADGRQPSWGIGLDDDMTTATLQAALVAVITCTRTASTA